MGGVGLVWSWKCWVRICRLSWTYLSTPHTPFNPTYRRHRNHRRRPRARHRRRLRRRHHARYRRRISRDHHRSLRVVRARRVGRVLREGVRELQAGRDLRAEEIEDERMGSLERRAGGCFRAEGGRGAGRGQTC